MAEPKNADMESPLVEVVDYGSLVVDVSNDPPLDVRTRSILSRAPYVPDDRNDILTGAPPRVYPRRSPLEDVDTYEFKFHGGQEPAEGYLAVFEVE
jgi:hypothetical protein